MLCFFLITERPTLAHAVADHVRYLLFFSCSSSLSILGNFSIVSLVQHEILSTKNLKLLLMLYIISSHTEWVKVSRKCSWNSKMLFFSGCVEGTFSLIMYKMCTKEKRYWLKINVISSSRSPVERTACTKQNIPFFYKFYKEQSRIPFFLSLFLTLSAFHFTRLTFSLLSPYDYCILYEIVKLSVFLFLSKTSECLHYSRVKKALHM